MKRTEASAQPDRHAAARAHRHDAAAVFGPRWAPGPAAPDAMQDDRLRAAGLFVHRWTETSVAAALQAQGIELRAFRTAAEWVAALHTTDFDVALVEDHAQQLASCLVTLRFRGTSTVPIVAVGGGSAEQISAALRLGAADYAVIGEAAHVLASRVLARIEMCRPSEQPLQRHAGPCTLDAQARTLSSGTTELQLTWREFALASVLFENAGQVVHLDTIARQVWGTDRTVAKRTIEQHVCRLRHKLSQACETHDVRLVVHAVTNVGYRLVTERRSAAPGH